MSVPQRGKRAEFVDAEDSVAGYPRSRTAWTIVFMLSAANILSFLDRQILALLVDPIKQKLAVSDFQMSLLIGPAFAIFYGVMGMPLGWAVDRVRRLSVASGGIFLWSMMTCLGGFATGFSGLLVARIGVGVGEASLLPAANSVIADCFPPERRTQPNGCFMMAVYIGSGLALTCGGLLIGLVEAERVHLGWLSGRSTWQSVLILVGAPGIFLAAATVFLPEPRRREMVTAVPCDDLSLTAFLRTRAAAIVGHFVAYSALIQVGYCLLAWAPSVLIREHGWPASKAGLWLGLIGMTSGVSSILVATRLADGLLARGMKSALFRIGACTALAGTGGALLLLRPETTAFLLSYAILLAVSAAGIGTNGAALSQITPNRFRGRVTGFFLIVSSLIGPGLGPPAVALLAARLPGPAPLSRAIMLTCLAALIAAVVSFTRGMAPFSAAVRQVDPGRRSGAA